jgi:DNA-binding NarL/FixJ family response regulator
MIKILVADDHQLLIDGIKSTLEDVEDIKIIAKANNGFEVIKILETKKADIVLMDINMPYMDGLECTKIINQKFPDIKVIALTQYDEKRFVKRMIKNGASGYLLKDASKAELLKAIRDVNAGKKYFSPKLSVKFLEDHYQTPRTNPLFPHLTEREQQVLNLICKEFSSNEISEQLNISYNTVENHRASLMEKSETKNTAGLVRWAVENELID